MKPKFMSILLLLMAVLVLTACASSGRAGGPSDPPTSSHGGTVNDLVSLVEALRSMGAQVETGDSVEQAFFIVKGQIITVNGADVQIYEYESAQAMEAEAALVASDGGSVGTSMLMWVATPHFYKSGNLLVLFVGDEAEVLDLLDRALGEQFAGR